MPGSKLVRLKTDLKSLKYGHDRQGDGNSGQPYITAPIPNRLSTSSSDDGFIRGGWSLANKASNEDSLRISKFFKDKPKGPLFIKRQIGLQLTNPKLETRTANLAGFGLLGSLLTIGFNAFNQLLPGPTRIYNEGKNTLAQIPVNAFGTHFERHGLSPVQDDNTKYLAVAYNNNQNGNNRLLALKKKLIRPNISSNKNIILGTINAILGAVNVFNRAIGRGTNPLLPSSPLLQPQDLIIDRYGGGPGSVYGVGLTTIRRFDVTSNGSNKPIPEKGKIDYAGGLGLSNFYFPKQNSTPEVNLTKVVLEVKYSNKSLSLLNDDNLLISVISVSLTSISNISPFASHIFILSSTQVSGSDTSSNIAWSPCNTFHWYGKLLPWFPESFKFPIDIVSYLINYNITNFNNIIKCC